MIPSVSVIIPAHNAEQFISETICSVIGQTYSDWELIVINDGSTDRTEEIVTKFLSDPRIRLINQKNSGVSHARNHGFNISRGEFISFLDADDLWHPDCLKKKVQYLQDNRSVGTITSYAHVIDKNSQCLPFSYKGQDEVVIERILEFDDEYTTFPSNLLCRREVVEKSGGFNPSLSNAADKLFIIEAALIANVSCLSEHLVYYRLHEQNMHKRLDLMISDYIRLYEIIDNKNLYKNATHRERCMARMYKICAGACFEQRQYMECLRWLLRSFWWSPSFLVSELFNRIFRRTRFDFRPLST